MRRNTLGTGPRTFDPFAGSSRGGPAADGSSELDKPAIPGTSPTAARSPTAGLEAPGRRSAQTDLTFGQPRGSGLWGQGARTWRRKLEHSDEVRIEISHLQADLDRLRSEPSSSTDIYGLQGEDFRRNNQIGRLEREIAAKNQEMWRLMELERLAQERGQ